MKLAVQLIEQITADEFHPENYEDVVRKRYHEAIQRKVEGQEVTSAAPEQPRGQIIDLMDALKASLAAKAAKESAAPKAAKTAARAAATAEDKKQARSSSQKAAATGRRRAS